MARTVKLVALIFVGFVWDSCNCNNCVTKLHFCQILENSDKVAAQSNGLGLLFNRHSVHCRICEPLNILDQNRANLLQPLVCCNFLFKAGLTVNLCVQQCDATFRYFCMSAYPYCPTKIACIHCSLQCSILPTQNAFLYICRFMKMGSFRV